MRTTKRGRETAERPKNPGSCESLSHSFLKIKKFQKSGKFSEGLWKSLKSKNAHWTLEARNERNERKSDTRTMCPLRYLNFEIWRKFNFLKDGKIWKYLYFCAKIQTFLKANFFLLISSLVKTRIFFSLPKCKISIIFCQIQNYAFFLKVDSFRVKLHSK